MAFAAFAIFIIFAIISSGGQNEAVRPDELEEVRKLTLFLIAALLPSDLLVRFGRNLLFQSVEDAQAGAAATPATTTAQRLAFAAYLAVVLLTLISNKLISSSEFTQINEVGRVLIIALLPSDAGVRFGRALYYRAPSTPVPNSEQLARV
jgi:hypothetical protein